MYTESHQSDGFAWIYEIFVGRNVVFFIYWSRKKVARDSEKNHWDSTSYLYTNLDHFARLYVFTVCYFATVRNLL